MMQSISGTKFPGWIPPFLYLWVLISSTMPWPTHKSSWNTLDQGETRVPAWRQCWSLQFSWWRERPVLWHRLTAHRVCLPFPFFQAQRPISFVGVKTQELVQHLQPCPAAPQSSWESSPHSPHRVSTTNSKRTTASRPVTRAFLLLRTPTEKYCFYLRTEKGRGFLHPLPAESP